MRIADTHHLPILLNKEVTAFLGREVFARCTEELEWHASRKSPMKLQLSPFDVYCIKKLYPQENVRLELKLAAVIEDIFLEAQIPYSLFPVLRIDVTRLVFHSRVKYRNGQ